MRKTLCRLDAIPDGGAIAAEVESSTGGFSVVLTRTGDAVHAFHNECPHAGRRLDWAPGRFLKDKQGHLVCAVHGATFELQGGQCIAGPCRGAALRTIPVVVEDGLVRVVRT